MTPLQVRAAVATFELAGLRSPRLRQDLGVALALAGEMPRALPVLSAAAARRDDPDTVSNLAAAYLLAYSRDRRAVDALLALEEASRALALQPAHAPAQFNQALALTALHVDDEARRAWRLYLDLDGRSPWADQARAALARQGAAPESLPPPWTEPPGSNTTIAPAIADSCVDSPHECRQRLQDSVLPEWGRAMLRRDASAASATLAEARLLARLLNAGVDSLDAATVADVERAVERRERRVVDLAAGLDAYGRARAAFENDEESVSLFLEAEHRLSKSSSPMAGWARANRVYAELNTYTGSRLDAAGQALRGWSAEASSRGFTALEGRLAYLEAVTFVNRAEYAAAEPLLAWSLRVLEQAREPDHLAATYVATASMQMRLGDSDAAWENLVRALAQLPHIRSARRRYTTLLNVGMWMGERDLPHGSAHLLSAARDTALRTGQPLRVAESSLYRAKAYGRLGLIETARADLETARPDPARNARWGRGERARYEYLAGVAEVETHARPQVAITAASDALTFFEGRDAAQRLAPLYLLRGRAYAAIGDLSQAERDFAAGVDAYERYRRGLPSVQQRLLSQEVVWDLYEERIRLAALRSPALALDVAEQGRALTLIESLRSRVDRRIAPAELRQMLAPETRVIYYALLQRELLIWVIGHDDVTFRRVAVDRASFERQVASVSQAIAADAPRRQWQESSAQLFDMLLSPVATAIPESASLIVVPDGALHRLPFAALVNPRTGRFAVETHSIATTPSATVLAHLLARPAARRSPQTMLAVANPAAAGGATPSLPGAEREALAIAQLYSRPQVLGRELATRTTFLRMAPSADVVHYAGHAIASPDYPMLARLQFANDERAGHSPSLDASTIATMQLDNTRLVVLAACTTAGGRIHRGEGVLSLARPFLAAGAQTVVASLWDIDDRASAGFLRLFHEQFVKDAHPARALRRAQISATTILPASIWAAFVVIGSPGDSTRPKEIGT